MTHANHIGRVVRIGWAAVAILAAVVVPLRVAEIARQHQPPIFKAESCTDAALERSQLTSQTRTKET